MKINPQEILEFSRKGDTVLIVEDDALNRAILVQALKDNYEILEAGDGKKGLELLNQNREKISIVLLDLLMPVMDGYAFLSKMAKDKSLCSIPVIILTASTSDAEQIKALKLGASDFISKPYNPHIIINRIQAMIRLRKSFDMLGAAALDRTTGVYSTEFFFAYAEEILKSRPKKQYDFVCANVENFRSINSRHGRRTGNSVLRTIAMLLQEPLKKEEIMCRVTGDCFAFLMTHRDQDEYKSMVKTALSKLKAGPVYPLSLKFGIYENVDHSESVSSMYEKASLARESIIKKYGESIFWFNDELRQKAQDERIIIDNMEEALDTRQFEVYYQPKHSIKENKTTGAEALVRWNNPKFGFMNPGTFIPLFEQNGFITRLDQYVWECVCKALRDCLETQVPVVPISVNISRADFDTKDLDKVIVKLADKYRIPHHLLHLEITESAYQDNPMQIHAIVEKLHCEGFLVELDDFGSGYSSLSVLSKMPLDILKLDMSLVHGIKSANGRNILSCIVELADRLKMETVAEGCEDAFSADALAELGVSYIQGFYYAKPLQFQTFVEYLKLHG